MYIIQGDLIELAKRGAFNLIVHGCNCFGGWKKGIATQIKAEFPAAYVADLHTNPGDHRKLGTISHAQIQLPEHVLTVVNGYTQFHWRGKGRKVDYDALRSVFHQIKRQFPGKRIGYPAIGAGLAGGDWSVISQIIDEELDGEEHTFVEYVPN